MAAAAARLDALEQLLPQLQASLTQHQTESADERETLVAVNHELKTQLEELKAQVELQGSSAEAGLARSLVPASLTSKVALRIQPIVDIYPLLRETFALLKRDPPDVERSLLKVGQACRLTNNVLAGADLSKQQPAAERPFEFIEHYYDQSKALALRPPLEADWKPEPELVKHDAARKAAVKLVEAEIAKAAKAKTDIAGGSSGSGYKRPAGGRLFNGPPQHRPFFNGGGAFNQQPPPPGAANAGGQARGVGHAGAQFGGAARGGGGGGGGFR
jgi:hypothetical protein